MIASSHSLMTKPTAIPQILLECENNGSAPPYVTSREPKRPDSIFDSQGPLVEIDSEGADILVVSDLHLASGMGLDGRYDGCENFFFDVSFQRFLQRANKEAAPALLIINGDFIDFLRVVYVPGQQRRLTRSERMLKRLKLRRRSKWIRQISAIDRKEFVEDYEDWSRILRKIGINMTPDELVRSITDKEEIYGLKTHDFKSVLRLDVVLKGHPVFFHSIAEWLGWGHKIIIVKGNHDLEWYWPAVRNYLRLALAERLAEIRFASAAAEEQVRDVLVETVLPNITFIDHAMVIDGDFYVEHGHPYDPLTRVIGEDTVNDGQELNIPFGSFFNRYLLNFLEEQFPYLDNVRPTKNILPLMLKNNFLTGLRLLIDHLAVILKTAPRQYIAYIFGQHIIFRVLVIVLAVLVPPVLLVVHQVTSAEPVITRILQWIAWLVLVYGVIQLLARAQLTEPDSLARFARRQFKNHAGYRLMTFGHTHNPDQFRKGDRWFYNTGTWIPIVETTTMTLREDRTFMYLHLGRDPSTGKLAPGTLQRWDDEAGRSEPLVLIRGVES